MFGGIYSPVSSGFPVSALCSFSAIAKQQNRIKFLATGDIAGKKYPQLTKCRWHACLKEIFTCNGGGTGEMSCLPLLWNISYSERRLCAVLLSEVGNS